MRNVKQDQINDLTGQLQRANYRVERADTWIDEVPGRFASVLGTTLTDFVPGRWTSAGILGNDVASITVSAKTSPVAVFKAISHPEVSDLKVNIDDDPDFPDFDPTVLAHIKQWWDHAVTGEKFDPNAAADALNAA